MSQSSTATIKRAARGPASCPEKPDHNTAESIASPQPRQRGGSERGEIRAQLLTFHLQGITAGDYLTWVRDPDPPALGRELRSLSVQADPLGDRIDLLLCWGGDPPAPRAAAAAAGFGLTPEVRELRATTR
jgi:hypothetical protein